MNAVEVLDGLIEQLDASHSPPVGGGDAIDQVQAAAPRATAVRSLRDDPAVIQFRNELVDGLIRVDTMGRLLNLINQVTGAILAGRG